MTDVDDLRKSFAFKLKALRRLSGLTQPELGDYLNASVNAISNWEIARSMPGAATVKDIAEIFGVSADWLLDVRWDMEAVPVDEAAAEKLAKMMEEFSAAGG